MSVSSAKLFTAQIEKVTANFNLKCGIEFGEVLQRLGCKRHEEEPGISFTGPVMDLERFYPQDLAKMRQGQLRF